jgi:hypothetical protein
MFHTIMDQSHRARMLTLRLRAKRHRAARRDEILPVLRQLGMKRLRQRAIGARLAALKTVGLRLSLAPQRHAAA